MRAQMSENTSPNIVIIMIDDLGRGDIGCYGNEVIRTPHLDNLARQGMRLIDAYSAGPMCSPSRAALLTGRDPNRVGVYDWIPPDHFMYLPENEITIAQLLWDAGYQTCHVGKWHLSWIKEGPDQPQPNDYGFEYWFSSQTNHPHRHPSDFFKNGQPVGKIEDYSCQIVTREAVNWLRDVRNPGRPFFQFVCYHEPHEHIEPPPEWKEKYAEYGVKAPYYATVAHLDDAIGKYLAALDEMDLAQNTLLIFTVDHGPARFNWGVFERSYGTPGPLRGFKRQLYEGGIRVPTLIRWPGYTESGQVVSEPICGTDILPTICDLLEIPVPDDRPIDGVSFLPIFKGKPIDRAIPLHWEFHHPWSGPQAVLRDEEWVLTAKLNTKYPYSGGFKKEFQPHFKYAQLRKFKLYNLAEDIGQQNDIAYAYPERVESMAEKLKSIYQEVHEEGPWW